MTSSIDTSLIDSSKPEEGNPTTASVRSNVLYIKAALNSAKAEIETLQTDVSSLNSAMRYMGGWDASAGTFPSGAQKGYVYSVSVAGTVDGVAFDTTDRINCILNNASTTVYAGNWLKEDYTDRVLSVFGRTGDITATTDDIPETSNKKYMTAAEKTLLEGTSGTNTGDETGTTIKSKLGLTNAIIAQVVLFFSGAVATGTATIPLDDSVPLNTEGTELLSLSITPTNASSKLLITAKLDLANTAAVVMIAALFRDSTVNAIKTTWKSIAAGNATSLMLYAEVDAGSTNTTTFKIRAGGHAAGTTTFNGSSSARFFGGTMDSFIKIEERLP
jgi:hypothetical protein